jgi:phenylacetate-CoA ligase
MRSTKEEITGMSVDDNGLRVGIAESTLVEKQQDHSTNTVARRRPRGRRFRDIAGIHLADDLDALSRDEIDSMQHHNLTATLAAARRAPVVRSRFPDLGTAATANDLKALPLLSPADLAAGCPPHSTEFLLDGGRAGLALRSSGTANQPKVVYHSWHSNDRVRHLGARGVRATVPVPPRRLANCMFAGEFGGAFLFVQDLAERLRALVFPLGSRTPPAEAAEIIVAHQIDTLVATPAYGVELVAGSLVGRDHPLRNLLYIGEPMGEERERTVRRSVPGLRVGSLAYSTSETGPVGYQCRYQSGTAHHIHEDAQVLEVVDDKGRPVPRGVPGELVVTPLTTSGMALFRYRLGDRGYFTTTTCECGSAARSVVLLGRTEQSMTVDGTTVSSDQLMGRLATLGIADPLDCQLEVRWEGHHYRARLVLSMGTPPGITADAVLAALREAHQLHRIITSRRCLSFTVQRIPAEQFARTRQGKVPVLYQHLDPGHD